MPQRARTAHATRRPDAGGHLKAKAKAPDAGGHLKAKAKAPDAGGHLKACATGNPRCGEGRLIADGGGFVDGGFASKFAAGPPAGYPPIVLMCAAMLPAARKASAATVNVGGKTPAVGNTMPPTM